MGMDTVVICIFNYLLDYCNIFLNDFSNIDYVKNRIQKY